MTLLGRHILLTQQDPDYEQTGIDFIAVNAANHAEVFVYFIVDPLDPGIGLASGDIDVRCFGVETRRERTVTVQAFAVHTDSLGNNRNVLSITFDSGASFETQLLTIADLAGARLDPFSSSAEFSFKQSCPTVFDCACRGAPGAPASNDYPVDYLARDFESYKDALSAFSANRYPDWQMDIVADQAVMLGETFAALADELAYIQDRYKLETEFEHLKERRSFEQLSRILGYKLRPELPATGLVVLRHYEGVVQPAGLAPNAVDVLAGTVLSGFGDHDNIVPFEIGTSLADIRDATPYRTDAVWTDIPVHVPDPTCPWIPRGAREIWVRGHALANPAIGKGTRLLIETRPRRQDLDLRRVIVELDGDPVTDHDLVIDSTVAPPGTGVTRLHWRAEDALPFDLDIQDAFVSGNLVPVMSGRTRSDRFVIGPGNDALRRAIEREGPARAGQPVRPVIFRHPLDHTVTEGLAWQAAEGATAWDVSYDAEVALQRIGGAGEDWRIVGDMLTQTATDEAATIEAGHWGPVFDYVEDTRNTSHRDFIGDPGYCLRFGDGEFGIPPADGSVFDIHYRTACAARANLSAGRIHLAFPGAVPPGTPIMPAEILSASNPVPFENAQAAENIELAKLVVPHFNRALKLRAVRNRDFQDLLNARTDIDASVAQSRWLGCWPATFLTVDPHGSIELSDQATSSVQAFIEEIRLVGRPAYLTGAALRPLDLQIVICRDRREPFGRIAEAIMDELVGPTPEALFHPDNLSFGHEVPRATLEARIAGVDGVTGIRRIRYRWRGEIGFTDFTASSLVCAPDQIPVLKHDPVRPNLGRIEIFEGRLPEETAP
jgi:hypothetical protein